MQRFIRSILRKTDQRSGLRLAFDCLGVFCACSLVWEHFYTIQLSEGASMYPTMNGRGDYLLISRRCSHGKGIGVGDLVRFYHPSFGGMHAAKRVLGMPGDFVCKDSAYSEDAGETGEMIQVSLLQFLLVPHQRPRMALAWDGTWFHYCRCNLDLDPNAMLSAV